MRAATALALVAAFTAQAAAQEAPACTMPEAVYSDGELGYELRFRKPERWELYGMMSGVYELKLPDGRELWGYVSGNMGTSRDIGSLYFGCERPGMDDGSMSEEEIDACRVWHNNVYAMVDGKATWVPNEGEPAAESLILADLGRTLRYSVLSSPGEEPWDQFFLVRCE